MFAIEVEFLTGRCYAASSDVRSEPEWPPHPSRLYSALAAAWHESDGTEAERDALLWLEQLPNPPQIAASSASQREAPTVYVPVNDVTTPSAKPGKAASEYHKLADILPERRGRQPRRFPSVTPAKPLVHFIWPDVTPPENNRAALLSICHRVASLGHSSSLARITLTDSPPPANYFPAEAGEHILRAPTPGQWSALNDAYVTHQGLRQRTLPTGFTAYSNEDPGKSGSLPRGKFNPQWLVLRLERRMMLRAALTLTAALRATMLKLYQERFGDPPEWLSGHTASNTQSQQSHVAYVPLADVGHRYADGHLLGLAVVLPAGLPVEARRQVRELCAQVEQLYWDHPVGTQDSNSTRMKLLLSETDRVALKSHTWMQPSLLWASVTPFVFDRHPGRNIFGAEAQESVRVACSIQDLPRPGRVIVTPVSRLLAVPLAAEFKPRKLPDRPSRQHVHVEIEFEEPIAGPLLLGAGRYYGYGFFRPVNAG